MHGTASSPTSIAGEPMTAHSAHDQTRHPDSPGSTHGDRMGVTGTQVAASVLASVSAAVIASMFGVAGTIVGAAVVSVVATISSAAYGLGIRRTQARLYKVQSLRVTRPPGGAIAHADGAGQDDRTSSEPADPGAVGGEPAPDPTADVTAVQGDVTAVASPANAGWRAWLSQRRWSVAAGVAIVFVISLASVTLIELVGDRPLSGESSGRRTSVGALLPGRGGDSESDSPDAPVTTEGPVSPAATPSESDSGRGTTTTTTAADGSGTTTTTSPAPTTTSTTVPPTTSTTSPPVSTPGAVTTVPPAEPAAPGG